MVPRLNVQSHLSRLGLIMRPAVRGRWHNNLQRDPASQLLVADLESELSRLAILATPQLKSALAEFGTGNRKAVWPRILAIANRGEPREKRIAARLRTMMLNYQDFDVSAQEVRDRWVAASSSDPSNLLALTALAGAQQYLGNSQDALDPLAASGLRTLLGNRRWNLSRAGSGRDAGVRPALTR